MPGVDDGVKLTEENFPPSGRPDTGPRPSFEDDGDTLQAASKDGDRFLDSCLILFERFRGAVLMEVVAG